MLNKNSNKEQNYDNSEFIENYDHPRKILTSFFHLVFKGNSEHIGEFGSSFTCSIARTLGKGFLESMDCAFIYSDDRKKCLDEAILKISIMSEVPTLNNNQMTLLNEFKTILELRQKHYSSDNLKIVVNE